ncbi:DUF2975 domain-containing protein [Aquibium microcysteis]|uniref:DUF2975 domain-containing protein n=1 Tax=Aquibium microcysteis TaxID=675281 RepID=UPI00165D12BC|nr:DUF2975 domain-containing protein [Aquibium microcysteis]
MSYDFEKARRLSRIMSVVTAFGGIAVAGTGLAFAAIAAFDPEWFGRIVSRQIAQDLPVTPSASAVVLALTGVQLAILLAALYCLWRMFDVFAADEPLSPRAALWMRRAGGIFLFSVASGLLIRTGVIAALTMANPSGQRMIAISVGSPDLLAVLMAGVLLMVGHILTTAAEIQDDNRTFV